jgi:hypothetical protein
VKTIALRNLGRFGNRMFRYAYARALAEQNGYELRTEPWEGETLFTLGHLIHARPDGTEDIVIDEYRQAQKDLIYSRADCRRWFHLRPWAEREGNLQRWPGPVVHYRRTDYAAAGYPLIGRKAVTRAMRAFEITESAYVVTDENPKTQPEYQGEMSFVPDFLTLLTAPILFRANSSFSWWAATLGTGRVFSPIITGFAGGIEHDGIPYVEGNWPRLAELDFVTDLHLRET